jgi:hypothetical protein
MGLTRSSFVKAMTFQSTTMFFSWLKLVLGSLQFVSDKFGDLSLQEPKASEVIGSSTSHLPPALVRVGQVNESQHVHRFRELGKMDLDSTGDKADHTPTVHVAATDPIF